jgi:hypothetical protein
MPSSKARQRVDANGAWLARSYSPFPQECVHAGDGLGAGGLMGTSAVTAAAGSSTPSASAIASAIASASNVPTPLSAAAIARGLHRAQISSKIGRKTDFVAKKLPNEKNMRGVTFARKLVNTAAGVDPLKRWRHGVGNRDTAINATDAEKVRLID